MNIMFDTNIQVSLAPAGQNIAEIPLQMFSVSEAQS
jgi:hypothetical protein